MGSKLDVGIVSLLNIVGLVPRPVILCELWLHDVSQSHFRTYQMGHRPDTVAVVVVG